MTEAYFYITASRAGSVGVIELARPKSFNCLSVGMFEEIVQALRSFEADATVRTLLIQAQGRNFCTGADLGEVKARRESAADLDAFLRRGHEALRALESSRLPVLGLVQGLCLAGGLELMLACDVVFADPGARFGDQHAQFGLAPGWGGSQRLPRAIGLRRAMDLFLGVRWIDAPTALSWGLVNYVCEEGALAREAMEYATKLGERSSGGLALMKRIARKGLDLDLSTALEFEIAEVAEPLRSAQVAEGIAAFEEKRKPVFN